MRHGFALAALLSLGLSLAPAQAQDSDAPTPPVPEGQEADQGQSLMERGACMFLEGMRREMEPALEDLRDLMVEMGPAMQQFMRDMGPAMADLLGRIDDLSAYEAPELLPNGDILIRRKPESGPLPPPADGEIDI
ncbi:MAG: hypothetical protein NWQ32_10345 [Paracoccaceae bacterium]|nr:hypothetical protein [Paracoccaceae bacterium]